MADAKTPEKTATPAQAHQTNASVNAAAAVAAAGAAGTPGGAPAGGHAPGGNEAASAAATATVNLRTKNRSGSLSGSVQEVIEGAKSPDLKTRMAAFGFILSIMGVAAVVIVGGTYFWQQRSHLQGGMTSTGEQGKNLDDFIKKQSDEAKMKFTTHSLGLFNIELKPVEGSRPGPGVMNIAEVEVQVQCDVKETCDILDDQQVKARNEVTIVFTATERDELLSREGKRRLKKKILDRLNAWIPKGKVEDLYFTKLIIN
jgi:flagellar basal body-associated protein FliL